MPVYLHYSTARGAGVMRALPANNAAIERALRTVRREARLDDQGGREIGGTFWCGDPGHAGRHPRRGHWSWWYEAQESPGDRGLELSADGTRVHCPYCGRVFPAGDLAASIGHECPAD